NASLLGLCKALDAAGIPYYCRKTDKFFETREIKCAVSLLCVIDNPRNNFEMLNLLSSELFGFTADELARLKIKDKRADLYSLLNAAAADNEKCASVIEKIAKYRTAAAQMPLCDLLYEIFDNSGLMNIAAAISGGQAMQNLRKLCSMAADFEKMYITGLSGFVRYVLRLKAANEDAPDPPADNSDTVKVMTIHNSKGLQFPICIVGSLEQAIIDNRRNHDVRVYQSEKCGIGLKIVDAENYIKYETLPFCAARLEKEQEMVSEEIRLLYVALTRAKEQLVMCATLKKQPEKYFSELAANIDTEGGVKAYAASCNYLIDMIAAASLDHPDCDNLRKLSVGEQAQNDDLGKEYAVNIYDAADIPDVEHDAGGELPEYDRDTVEGLARRIAYRYPYEKINAVAAKQAASRLAHQNEYANYSCSAVPLFLQGKKLTAAQRGTAMHKLMQYVDLKAAANDLDRELKRIESLQLLSAEEIESIDKDAVSKFAKSKLGQRMAAAVEIYHEREFMVELAATELDNTLGSEFADETVVVQGAVDCVFFEGDKMVIVDYKTDRVKDLEELRRKYEIQLKVYEKALNQVFGERKTELIIYSFRLSDQIVL
ncbi:MAG: UvrD-helicase domain-containing protein, partial [Acutalibacteraceae bacterium]